MRHERLDRRGTRGPRKHAGTFRRGGACRRCRAGTRSRYRLRLARLREAAEFIVLERLCCPFFDFALSLGAGSSAFQLAVTGSDGIKPFTQAEFSSVLPLA